MAGSTSNAADALGALWPEGRNLMRYDRDATVLGDHHGPVLVGAWNSDQMGVAQLFLQAYGPTAARPVFDPLLRLFIDAGRGCESVPVVERTCWPGGWVETGAIDNAEVEQRVWFPSPGELAIRWRITPTTLAPATFRLAASGGHTHSPLELTGAADGGAVRLHVASPDRDTDGERVMEADFRLAADTPATRVRFRTDLPGSPLRARLESGPPALRAKTECIDGRVLSAGSLPPREDELADEAGSARHLGYWMELAPPSPAVGGSVEAGVTLSWRFSGTPFPEPDRRLGFVEAIERQRALHERMPLERIPDAYWRRKAGLAVGGLLTSLVKAPGYGNLEKKLAVGARTLGHLSVSYFWDAMTTVPALAHLDPDWAVEAVETFTQHRGSHDCPPFAVAAFPHLKGRRRTWHGSQAPIAGWAVRKLAVCAGNEEVGRRLYPALKWINDSWFEHADRNRDGIPEWMNTGAPADNSPLFDTYGGRPGWNNIYLPPIASVSLCSYLLMDLRCLADIADALGKDGEAAAWREKRAVLERKTLDLLWCAEEKTFYDRDLTVHELTRVKTFFNLLPLWAGIDLPEADARAAIEAHLLNPEEMWGAIPFPSVAYDEPTYDPLGYWRGRSWPHIYFWNTEILARYGYTDEADEAKRRFLRVMADGIDIPENFVSRLDHPQRHEQGFPHYSWGLAILLYFLWDWHKQPV